MAQPQIYLTKHPFQGDARQSQLSFPKGATINAKPNQTGAWWWGSCNGKEGWFPPAYVKPMAPQVTTAPTPQVQPQMSMQQRMQNATFAPSVKQQQFAPAPVNPSLANAFQGAPAYGQPQPSPASYGQPSPASYAAQGQSHSYQGHGMVQPQRQTIPLAPADPFAGLENMGTAPAPAVPMQQHQPPPLSTTNQSVSQSMNSNMSLTTNMSVATPTNVATPTIATIPDSKYVTVRQQSRSKSPVPPVNTPTSRPSSKSPTPNNVNPIKSATSPPPPQQQRSKSKSPTPMHTNPTASAKPVALSKDEVKARKVREKEQAKLRAQMLKEKEELKKEQQQVSTSGIGSSGVALLQTNDGSGEVEVGLSAGGSGGVGPSFNAFDFLAGTTGGLPTRKFSPIFRVPPFWALMDLETYVRRFPLSEEQLADRNAGYQQLAKALSFVCHVVAQSEEATKTGIGRFASFRVKNNEASGPLAFLKWNHMACEACVKLISLLPHSAGASGKALDGLFLNFMNVFVSLLENLEADQQLVVPGGWQQPDYHYLCLYIVRNCGGNKYSFTVCNTGKDGLQYHPSTFDSETGRQLKQLALTVWNIPGRRVLDSTFWTILFRMQVYPSKNNSAEFLYTKLLPSLNSQPLRSNFDQGPAEYLEIPDPIASSSFHPLAKLAMTTTPQSGMRSSKYSSLLLMNAAVDLAYAEIERAPPSSMDPEDTRILKLTGRNLANFASTMNANTVGDGTLGHSLSSTWDLLDKLQRKLGVTASKAMDQYSHGLSKSALNDDFSKGSIKSLRTDAGSAAYPLFGRLRRDDYENVVKKLMGDPRPDPILIPAVLTDEKLPHVAIDFMTASSSLQRVADACSLLLQQRRLIKNSPAFAASAAQYAITVMLPMPHTDPRYCFWRKNEMRRETQVNLLFLIRRICRIYSAATACVQQSRGLIAIRSITFACAGCIADAICRVKAVDDPSAFALHYSGLCEGPTQAFAIEAGSFDTLGSNLPIYDPNLCSLRFRCLDYLRSMTFNEHGVKRNTIFNFDNSMVPTEGDMILATQLSIQLALVRPYPATDEAMLNHTANLISGKNGSILEVLPEFGYFRDIVFHFKHAVSGTSQTAEDIPKNKTWLPSDATLHWRLKRNEKDKEDPRRYYDVRAFEDHPQEYVEVVAQEVKSESQFKGFLSLFSSKERAVRSRLSAADPTTVVNSCGDKYLTKRYVLFLALISCVTFLGQIELTFPSYFYLIIVESRYLFEPKTTFCILITNSYPHSVMSCHHRTPKSSFSS